jgi:hypothetical protein
MGQTNSNPVRLYTRYIGILKIIQYLGYFFVLVFLGLILASARGVSEPGSLSPLPLLFFVVTSKWDDWRCYSSTDSYR